MTEMKRKPLSLLRGFVEETGSDLRTNGQWTWEPRGTKCIAQESSSPTTEYSTEGGED